MKIALLPPIPDLERFQDESRLHMLLAHLWDKPGYTHFYRKRRQSGDYLIIDNGACENDRPVSISRLFSCAADVGAQEVVIPDVQLEAGQTIAELDRTLTFLSGTGGQDAWRLAGSPRLMFVPQGQDFKEWKRCMARGLERLRRVGISPVVAVAKQYEPMGGRLRFVKELLEVGAVEVHLLGWSPPWDSLVDVARGASWVRSCDSAKPFNYAKWGVTLRLEEKIDRIPRADDYFDTPVPYDQEWKARANIATFRTAAQGGQRVTA